MIEEGTNRPIVAEATGYATAWPSSKEGPQIAIRATAHKLALIFYSMLKNQTEYRRGTANEYEERHRQNQLKSLLKQAATFGLTLTLLETVH